MPSFFSRVGRAFTTKKLDHGDHHQPPAISIPPPNAESSVVATAGDDIPDSAPLGGAYIPVSPTVSPSAAAFIENTQTRLKEERSLTASLTQLLRSRSPTRVPYTSPIVNVRKKRANNAPVLSLHLDNPANALDNGGTSGGFNAVFESGLARDNEGDVMLDDNTILERRLGPSESIALLRATSIIIKERGLTTLGLFKPHWHSSTPLSQKAMISLFLTTLANPESIMRPSPQQRFESELQYSQSPHDIAAVFKWAIRHLQLSEDTFGFPHEISDNDNWGWYRTFAESERSASYPEDAFSTLLVPTLPDSHAELLRLVLDLTSAVAANADANATSGSKLSKTLGWWLVSNRAIQPSPQTWSAFYSEWEFAARVLEHLFLAFVRDQESSNKLPKRLTELIAKYPYEKYSVPEDRGLLARPRFSTRRRDALHIQLKKDHCTHPGTSPTDFVALVEEVIGCETYDVADTEGNDTAIDLWEKLKQTAVAVDQVISESTTITAEEDARNNVNGPPVVIEQILADETLRILALASTTKPANARSSSLGTSEITIPSPPAAYRRSFSFNDSLPQTPSTENKRVTATVLGHARASTSPGVISSNPPPTVADWQTFAVGGFGELSTSDFTFSSFKHNLTPTDSAPASQPPSAWLTRQITSRRKRTSQDGSPRRGSLEGITPTSAPVTPVLEQPPPLSRTISTVSIVKIDEAFVDVWADSIQDLTMTKDWPSFIICQLRNPLIKPATSDSAAEAIEWLIIENLYVKSPSYHGDQAASAYLASSTHARSTSSMAGKKSRLNSLFKNLKSGSTTASSHVVVNGTGASGLARKLSDGGHGGRLSHKLSDRMTEIQAESHPEEAGESALCDNPPEGVSLAMADTGVVRSGLTVEVTEQGEGTRTPTNSATVVSASAVVDNQSARLQQGLYGQPTFASLPEKGESPQLSMAEVLEADPVSRHPLDPSPTEFASSPISSSVVGAFPEPPYNNPSDDVAHPIPALETTAPEPARDNGEHQSTGSTMEEIRRSEELRGEDGLKKERVHPKPEENGSRIDVEPRDQTQAAGVLAENIDAEQQAVLTSEQPEQQQFQQQETKDENPAVQPESEAPASQGVEVQSVQLVVPKLSDAEDIGRKGKVENAQHLEGKEDIGVELSEREILDADRGSPTVVVLRSLVKNAGESAPEMATQDELDVGGAEKQPPNSEQAGYGSAISVQAKEDEATVVPIATKATVEPPADLVEEQVKSNESRVLSEFEAPVIVEAGTLEGAQAVPELEEQRCFVVERAERECNTTEATPSKGISSEEAEDQCPTTERVGCHHISMEHANGERVAVPGPAGEQVGPEADTAGGVDPNHLESAETTVDACELVVKDNIEEEPFEAESAEPGLVEHERIGEIQRPEELRTEDENIEQERITVSKGEQPKPAINDLDEHELAIERAEDEHITTEKQGEQNIDVEAAHDADGEPRQHEAKTVSPGAEAQQGAHVVANEERLEERLGEPIVTNTQVEVIADAKRSEDKEAQAEDPEEAGNAKSQGVSQAEAARLEKERVEAARPEAECVSEEATPQQRAVNEDAEAEDLIRQDPTERLCQDEDIQAAAEKLETKRTDQEKLSHEAEVQEKQPSVTHAKAEERAGHDQIIVEDQLRPVEAEYLNKDEKSILEELNGAQRISEHAVPPQPEAPPSSETQDGAQPGHYELNHLYHLESNLGTATQNSTNGHPSTKQPSPDANESPEAFPSVLQPAT